MARILLVDDNQHIHDLLGELLNLEGHKVENCKSGAEALAYLEVDSGFDLLILDLSMPRLGGEDVLKRLSGGNLPIIVLSGEINIEEVAGRYGVKGIPKDCAPDELLSAVTAATTPSKSETPPS